MSFLSKLFNKKDRRLSIVGLGDFTYCKDRVDEYWMIEKPVGELPAQFDFGAIVGNIEGPDLEALEKFRYLSSNVDEIFSLINPLFYDQVSSRFGSLGIDQVKSQFFIKTLSCASRNEFEFGLHSIESDVFVELFCRDGVVSEVHIDEGCCEDM